MIAMLLPDPPPGWLRWLRQARQRAPALLTGSVAWLCTVLAILLTGSIAGCGGGVGTEGTGTFAGSVGSGPITGFGSILVSGVRYEHSAATIDDEDGNPVDRASLALGMVVQVDAQAIRTAAGGDAMNATATHVRTRRALLGPARAIDAAAGHLQVLAQQVLVTGDTVFSAKLAGGLSTLSEGQLLQVHGMYDASRTAWVATHIALAAAGSTFRVTGPVASVDPGQGFTLGSQRYVAASSDLVAGAVVQLQVQPEPDAEGRWVVSALRTLDVAADERQHVSLEAMVASVLSSSRFIVDGTTVDTRTALVTGSVQPGALVQVHGSLQGGVLLASRVEASPSGQVRGFELRGKLSQPDTASQRFVLHGLTVSYAGAGFNGGSAATLVGYTGTLEVQGRLSADRQVLEAISISFKN
jgi:hypothetical protein